MENTRKDKEIEGLKILESLPKEIQHEALKKYSAGRLPIYAKHDKGSFACFPVPLTNKQLQARNTDFEKYDSDFLDYLKTL